MVYLTNEQAAMLDGLLANVQAAAADIQAGRTGSAAPILDYVAEARARLGAEMSRGDKLATVNADTPAISAVLDDVERWGDAPIADVRAAAEVAGSTLSRGKCLRGLVGAAVLRLVYPDPPAPVPDGQVTVDVPPVTASD